MKIISFQVYLIFMMDYPHQKYQIHLEEDNYLTVAYPLVSTASKTALCVEVKANKILLSKNANCKTRMYFR
jgi:hypothetical protein